MTALRGPRVRLDPVAPEHVRELLRIHRTDEVRARWGEPEPDFPFHDAEATSFTVHLEDRIVGFVQYSEEATPMYRHAGVDIFLDPAVHGRGFRPVWIMRSYERGLDGSWHDGLLMDLLAGDLVRPS